MTSINKFFDLLRAMIRLIGVASSYLLLAMVLVTFFIVMLRYGFSLGWIWLQESIIWMHAAVFLLVAPYAFSQDAHVRVDVFYRQWSQKTKNKVNLVGSLLCLCPVALFLIIGSFDYVIASWETKETSKDAGGLIYPFIPLLKTFIPITGLLLFFQGLISAKDSFNWINDD
ncbi:TRAP transporter small permease subunit [Gammaproteobacteria bacterium]|nr:TRAP transporter small permease subunit [Gammaproteobacteria bacterium]